VDARYIRIGAAVGLEPYVMLAQYLDLEDENEVNEFDDFFEEIDAEPEPDGMLDQATVEAIRKGTSTITDVEAAERLLDQVAALMVSVSTGGPEIKSVDSDYKRDYRALGAVLKRLGITNPNPFGDLWRWYGKWSDGGLPSYASRRIFVSEMYAPARDALEGHASAAYEIAGATDDGPTGWADVDAKMGKLRRRMREADDVDDFKALGLLCVSVIEALGRAAFDPGRHLPAAHDDPHPNAARERLGLFLTAVTPGKRFEEVRTLIRASWRQAEAVKHRNEPNRTDAGIAADATALLVAMVRRLADEDGQSRNADDDIPF
jgi:hypothetical protein